MSKEATGQMGAIIGSDPYWSKINSNTLFGSLMGSRTDYQAAIGQLGTKAAAVIEEVYEDLSNLGGAIRYLPSSDRNALAKQVEGLYDICKMSGVSVWHNSECIHGLNLSIMSPWGSCFRDERGIEKAIDFIGKCEFKYTCTRLSTFVKVKFTMEDKYNFDHIRPIYGSIENFLRFKINVGSLANNIGLFSQSDGVISNYYSFFAFEKTIELN